jgi:hypothetical protein
VFFKSNLCLGVEIVHDELGSVRPDLGQGPVCSSHSFLDLGLRVVETVFHTLFGKLETSGTLEVRFGASLSAENSAKPAGSKGSGLDVLVLAGNPDVLHGTDIVRHVLVDGVDRLVAVLSSNVLGSRTHLDKGLQVDLDHWIKSWTQSPGKLLDQVASVAGGRCSQRCSDLDDAGLHLLHRRHEESVIIGRGVSLQQSPHLGDTLVTVAPVLFTLPAFEVWKHIAECILELSLRMDVDGVHRNLLRWWRASGFAIDALGEMRIEDRKRTSGL